LTKAWGVRGGFNHNWNPYWTTGLFGSYSQVLYGGTVGDLTTAKGAYCAAFAVSHPGLGVTYTCDPSFSAAELGVTTSWTPLKNLTFTGEVMWFRLDTKFAGASTFGAGAPKPVATYEFKDQDAFHMRFRVSTQLLRTIVSRPAARPSGNALPGGFIFPCM